MFESASGRVCHLAPLAGRGRHSQSEFRVRGPIRESELDARAPHHSRCSASAFFYYVRTAAGRPPTPSRRKSGAREQTGGVPGSAPRSDELHVRRRDWRSARDARPGSGRRECQSQHGASSRWRCQSDCKLVQPPAFRAANRWMILVLPNVGFGGVLCRIDRYCRLSRHRTSTYGARSATLER